MPQPILCTDRLRLVPLADRHLELEVGLDSDAEVLRYIFGRARTRDEVVESHAERMALGRNVDGLGFWIAYRSSGGVPERPPRDEGAAEFVGLMMLPPAHGPDQPDDPSVAELGYRIARRHWRQGFASEASRALLRHAFETVGQARVIAQTMNVNVASRGVMESLGMRYVRTFEGTWDEPIPEPDQREVEYELTRAMWEVQNPA
ncbi:GNAT family N-acetyltransferase [Solicola gregarius]|uniref:GNAT family N-acetyltransferase n=1 Tax=Solicola gregarius TaxID=2908642 RepID=A0AA46YJ82_9ACTN|nr:GNAT family N-acetyltransferase [Solicola gregarius]UYM04260.1 GNAT family N-acetyltransferase [Solicola gregarius]